MLDVVPGVLRTVRRITGMRWAGVARVTETSWTACAVSDDMDFGLMPGDRLPVDTTLCDEVRGHRTPVIFGHASAHPRFSTHPTPLRYGLESYVSVPIITAGGDFFGTLCAIDSRPLPLDEASVLETMALLADLIASHLTMQGRVKDTEAELARETDAGELREQFLAIVGHDLRSPLQVARLVSEQLTLGAAPSRVPRLVSMLDQSLARMAGLIDDIMDFARGRLGGGIPVELMARGTLARTLESAVAEVRAGQPQARFELHAGAMGEVSFDPKRIQQLIANLLNNAVAHGDTSRPIVVTARRSRDFIEIRITNAGSPIPAEALPTLFHPFVRPDRHTPRPGLGLGLYIASEIARAHDGELAVEWSDSRGTQFLFRFPAHPRIDVARGVPSAVTGGVRYSHGLEARYIARRNAFGLISVIELVTPAGDCFDTVDFPDDEETNRRAVTDEGARGEIARVLSEARGVTVQA